MKAFQCGSYCFHIICLKLLWWNTFCLSLWYSQFPFQFDLNRLSMARSPYSNHRSYLNCQNSSINRRFWYPLMYRILLAQPYLQNLNFPLMSYHRLKYHCHDNLYRQSMYVWFRCRRNFHFLHHRFHCHFLLCLFFFFDDKSTKIPKFFRSATPFYCWDELWFPHNWRIVLIPSQNTLLRDLIEMLPAYDQICFHHCNVLLYLLFCFRFLPNEVNNSVFRVVVH